MFERSELVQEGGVVLVFSGVLLSFIMMLVLAEVGRTGEKGRLFAVLTLFAEVGGRMGEKGKLFAVLTRVGVCSQGIHHWRNQML
jgi:hypothetical protein